jgi:hypothetical protein
MRCHPHTKGAKHLVSQRILQQRNETKLYFLSEGKGPPLGRLRQNMQASASTMEPNPEEMPSSMVKGQLPPFKEPDIPEAPTIMDALNLKEDLRFQRGRTELQQFTNLSEAELKWEQVQQLSQRLRREGRVDFTRDDIDPQQGADEVLREFDRLDANPPKGYEFFYQHLSYPQVPDDVNNPLSRVFQYNRFKHASSRLFDGMHVVIPDYDYSNDQWMECVAGDFAHVGGWAFFWRHVPYNLLCPHGAS